MTDKPFESFFDNIQDPRHHNKRHQLIDIIFIVQWFPEQTLMNKLKISVTNE